MGMSFEDRSAKFLADLEVKADLAVASAAEFLAQGIQDTMHGVGAGLKPGSGEAFGKKNQYIPSTPGSPPGVRTNRLKGSIASVKTGKKMQRKVGTNVEYARIQEFGGTINHPGGTHYIMTDDGPRFLRDEKALEMKLEGKFVGVTKPHPITLPPRPFMAPGLRNSKAGMLQQFKRVMKRGLK